MILTNKLNLPQALYDAVKNDPYTKGDADLSVTQLSKPMQAVVLEKRHADEITEDASERLWSLYGQVTHNILERANRDTKIVCERRLSMTVDELKISGAMDSYNQVDHELADWKFTTAWKFMKDKGVPQEWEEQQNCYAELLRLNGDSIQRLEVIGLIRDHSKREALRNPRYPELPVVRMEIPLWPREKVQAWIKERVAAYKQAQEQLPICSDDERWAKPDKWAVVSPGALKPTLKLHDSEEEAKAHQENLSRKYPEKTYQVEFRVGENIRCESYCSAAPFCPQWKAIQEKRQTTKLERVANG